MLIAFSVCLLAAIIFCNFALIFCKKIPCVFEGNQDVGRQRNSLAFGISGQNPAAPRTISTEELSKIAPIKKYSDVSNKQHRGDHVNCNKGSSFSGHISSGSTQKSRSNYSCVICLNHIRQEDLVRTLPCRHIYHFKCIDEWVKIKSNCPLCNTNLTSINILHIPEREAALNTPNRAQTYEEVEFSEADNPIHLLAGKLLA